MAPADQPLITHVEGSTGWLTFNRPDRLNAIDQFMWKALPEAISRLDAHPDVRTIVLKGVDDRAFVSGADISEFDTVRQNSRTNAEFTTHVYAATAAIAGASRPTIALIKGYCIGGGIVIATACDLRLAATNARFGVPAGKLGLGYELENYHRLASIVGSANALEMLLTARQYDAEAAMRMGLVNNVSPASDLDDMLAGYLEDISRLAPLTLKAAKAANQAVFNPQMRAQAEAAIDACFDSRDFVEGREAFRQKRAPDFTGA